MLAITMGYLTQVGCHARTMRWYLFLLHLLTFVYNVSSQEETLVIRYQIQEEVPEDTWIGNIAQSLGLNTTGLGTGTEFGFLSESAPHRQYFSLCCGGELRTRGRYDRDTLCPGSVDVCELSVDVTVRTQEGFYIAKVLLESVGHRR